jgi:membrane protein required for colicin V production
MIKLASLDWVMLVFIAFFAAKGGWRGLVRESFGYAAIILGIIGLLAFGDEVALVIVRRFDWAMVPARICGYVVAFLIPYLVIMIAAYFIKKFLHTIELGGMDRLVGVAFGALAGAVFAGSLLVAAERVGFTNGYMTEATLAPLMKDIFSYALDAVAIAWSQLMGLKS